jgi:hypothetical protein
MLQASAQAVDFKVGRYFGEGHPDYVTIAGGLGYWSPNIILTNDNVYVTVFGLGTPGGSPLYINAGYLDGNHSPKDIDDFVNQWGGSACAFMGAGGCRTWAPRNKWATEVGIGLPGAGVSGGYTNRLWGRKSWHPRFGAGGAGAF